MCVRACKYLGTSSILTFKATDGLHKVWYEGYSLRYEGYSLRYEGYSLRYEGYSLRKHSNLEDILNSPKCQKKHGKRTKL